MAPLPSRRLPCQLFLAKSHTRCTHTYTLYRDRIRIFAFHSVDKTRGWPCASRHVYPVGKGADPGCGGSSLNLGPIAGVDEGRCENSVAEMMRSSTLAVEHGDGAVSQPGYPMRPRGVPEGANTNAEGGTTVRRFADVSDHSRALLGPFCVSRSEASRHRSPEE